MRRAKTSWTRGALIGVLGLLAMAVPACDNTASTGPGGVTANLVVTFEPNPTMHFRYGEWLYRVNVSETNGVGVYIYGWVRQGFSGAGQEYEEDVRSEVQFINEFDSCGGEGNYIEPGGTRCSDRMLQEGRNSGWQIFTFYGVDDFGNEVSGTGRHELL